MSLVKRNIKIITATGVTLFTLVTSFTATFAWFSSNLSVSANNMSVKVRKDGTAYESGMSIHRCFTNESAANNLSFNHTAATTAQCKIDDYSTLNTTQPVMLLFPLGEKVNGVYQGAYAKDVSLSVNSTTGTGYADVSTNANDDNYYGDFPFTSACSFRAVAYTGEVPVNANASRYYVKYTALEENDPRCYVGDLKSFVTPASTTQLSWNGNDISIFNGSTALGAAATTTVIKYLAVVIDYYQPALSVIFRVGSGNNANPLTFDMDFTMVIS